MQIFTKIESKIYHIVFYTVWYALFHFRYIHGIKYVYYTSTIYRMKSGSRICSNIQENCIKRLIVCLYAILILDGGGVQIYLESNLADLWFYVTWIRAHVSLVVCFLLNVLLKWILQLTADISLVPKLFACVCFSLYSHGVTRAPRNKQTSTMNKAIFGNLNYYFLI